jgi:hypothetical protein
VQKSVLLRELQKEIQCSLDSEIWSTFRHLQFSVLTVLNFQLDFQQI